MRSGNQTTDSTENGSWQRPEKLSVVMSAHNEESTVGYAVEASLNADVSPLELELVVVDDGSYDSTPHILKRYEDRPNVKLLTHTGNLGKGTAIRNALELVSGEIVLIEDADLELDPKEYPKLVAPILAAEADVVFGSRFRGRIENMSRGRKLGNRLVSLVTSILYGTWITDEATCYKVFRAEVIRSFNLQCTGFDFCAEATAKTLRGGYRYVEVPVDYCGRTVKEGKKVRLRDGHHAIWVLLKYRFGPRKWEDHQA
jgi:glycosyltransferase involved in cell wall biosynthesis